MILESICWTSDRRLDGTRTDEQALEAVRVIGLVFDHLRNFSVLVYMKICDWTYQGREISLREMHKPDYRRLVVFDAQEAILSEWIDQLQFTIK